MRTSRTCARKNATDKELLPSWHATRRRRHVVVGAGAGAVAMVWAGAVISWNLAPSDTAMYWTIGLLVAAILIAVPVISVLNVATRGTVSVSERQLDERQVTERLRSYMVAHRLMLLVLAVVVAVIYTVPGGRDTYIPIAAIVTGIMALLLTHLLMPLLVAGWRQPDPPPEDDEDEDGETA